MTYHSRFAAFALVVALFMLTAQPFVDSDLRLPSSHHNGEKNLTAETERSAASPVAVMPTSTPAMGEFMAGLPLAFEVNHGQLSEGVEFSARGADYGIALNAEGATLALGGHTPSVLSLRLEGARAVQGEGLERLPGVVNIFRGEDPAEWFRGIPTFAGVSYSGVYPGVDLVYRGFGQQLEYDFVVAPGADPTQISLRWEGTEYIELDDNGDLLLHTHLGVVRQSAPLTYQGDEAGARSVIPSRYDLAADGSVGFVLDAYDSTQPVVIDPVVAFATYLGGSDLESGNAVAVDEVGDVYVTGTTWSSDFPLQNPFQGTYGGDFGDVFVSKISADGQTLLYSTYVGGSVSDAGDDIEVDAAGNVYVAGVSGGSASFNDFPLVNAVQPDYGGTDDGIVFKLSPDGSELLFSTYFGGGDTDLFRSIRLDGAGSIVVAGSGGAGYLTTPGAYDRDEPFIGSKGVVTKFSSDGQAVLASTFFPGGIHALSLDAAGRPYLTGRGASFTATPGAFQPTSAGQLDAWMAVLSADLSTLDAGTYLGGSDGDRGEGIAVDATGNAYITGRTESNDAALQPFPITPGVFQPGAPAGTTPGFVSKISGDATTLIYSSFLGGTGNTHPFDLTIDAEGRAYVTGETATDDFPLVDQLQTCSTSDGDDAFVTQVDQDASALLFSTCLAAFGTVSGFHIVEDGHGHVYVTGETSSASFPTVDPLQARFGRGSLDAFLVRYDFESASTSGVLVGTVTDSVTGDPIVGATVDAGGGGSTSTDGGGAYTFPTIPVGTYSVTASADGYAANTASGVVISDGATTTQNFVLDPVNVPSGVLQGTVTDSATGDPISGATVDAGALGMTATDGSGNYVLAGDPGTYAVTASASGYSSSTAAGVVVNDGGTTTQNFALEAITGCAVNCLRVSSIALSLQRTRVKAVVTVVDENGVLQNSATVDVHWDLPGGGTLDASGTTRRSGTATFQNGSGNGLYTITVTGIVKTGMTFDPANSILSASITK